MPMQAEAGNPRGCRMPIQVACMTMHRETAEGPESRPRVHQVHLWQEILDPEPESKAAGRMREHLFEIASIR